METQQLAVNWFVGCFLILFVAFGVGMALKPKLVFRILPFDDSLRDAFEGTVGVLKARVTGAVMAIFAVSVLNAEFHFLPINHESFFVVVAACMLGLSMIYGAAMLFVPEHKLDEWRVVMPLRLGQSRKIRLVTTRAQGAFLLFGPPAAYLLWRGSQIP